MIRSIISSVFLGVLLATLAACGKKGAGGPPPKMVMQVVATEAKSEKIAETISLVGNLLANESVEIRSEIDGSVSEINFEEGQHVEKGHLLIRIDESKLAAALAEVEANLKLSKANFERSEQLFNEKLIAQQEFDQMSSMYDINKANLELKRQQLKDARIVAPFAGILGARNVSPGQVITSALPLTWLSDIDPVKVEVNVPERFLSRLKVGQRVEIKVAAYPGQSFFGEAYFIADRVDPLTRTALVKATIPNAELLLKPGMFASLALTLDVRNDAIVVPETAVSQLGEGNTATLFVIGPDNAAQMRNVTLGLRLAGKVEVVKGLKEGELVITEGLQKIGPGMPVKRASEQSAEPSRPTTK